MNFITIWRPVKPENINPASDGILFAKFHEYFRSPAGDQRIIFAGWAASDKTYPLTPTDILVLEKNKSGKIVDKTDALFSDKSTNGVGAIVVADFNKDGETDLFLPSDNEGSLVPYGGVAFLSSSSGYKKSYLPGKSLTHDATLGLRNGQLYVVTGSLGGDPNPVYSFDGDKFVQSFANHTVWGNTVVVIPAASPDQFLTIKGDVGGSFTIDPVSGNYNWDRLDIEVYRGDGWSYSDSRPIQRITPYLATLNQFANFESAYGKGVAHTTKIFSDDLNNDGLVDLLIGQSMWVRAYKGNFPSALQILQNTGKDSFVDRTPTLNPDRGFDFDEGDCSPLIADIDKSGIKSFAFTGGMSNYGSIDHWPFFLMLNDGSGRLHIGLDNAKGRQLLSQLKKETVSLPELKGYQLRTGESGELVADFFGVVRDDKGLDFLARVQAKDLSNNNVVYAFFSLDYKFDPTTDFKQDITISDRNQSTKLRTWAGNDKIYDFNSSNTVTSIDGGQGIDSLIFSKNKSSYVISKSGDRTEVRQNQSGDKNNAIDTIINIERLVFADTALALDVSTTAGSSYRIYKAAFNRDPINGDTKGLGYWIGQMDKGMDLIEVSARFVDSKEFRDLYGSNPTNAQFLTKLYQNVLGRAPEATGYNWWLNELNTNPSKTKAKVLADFSESGENQTGVAALIGNGIAYEPWVG